MWVLAYIKSRQKEAYVYAQLSRGQWWREASCCHDMHSMQWVRTLPITMRTVRCCAHVIQCNFIPPDKTGHLQCAGLVETRPFTSNEAVVQSNQCWFVTCLLQLHIILCWLRSTVYILSLYTGHNLWPNFYCRNMGLAHVKIGLNANIYIYVYIYIVS